MPNYVYRCEKCNRTKMELKHLDMRYAAPSCGWCGVKMSIIMQPMAMLNRQKPGTISAAIDKGIKTCDGDMSVYHTLRNDEAKGGEHWKRVQADHDPGAIKESLDWGKAHGL